MRLGETDSLWKTGHQLGSHAFGFEPAHVILRRAVRRIDTQPHRGAVIVRRGDVLPVVGPVAFQCIEQPPRMVENCFSFRRLFLENPVANRAPQYGVDERCVTRPAQQARRLDALRRDGSMIGNAGVAELVEPHRNQCADDAVAFFERTIEQRFDRAFQSPAMTKYPVTQQPQ